MLCYTAVMWWLVEPEVNQNEQGEEDEEVSVNLRTIPL